MKLHGQRRGSILVLSIFLMVALFIVSMAFLSLLPVEARSAVRSEKIAMGGLAADAGITDALAWLRYQLAPKDGSASREPLAASVYPSQTERTRSLGGGWSFRWSLVADEQTYPNGNNTIRGYTIIARAYFNGVAQREARAQVIQESLSQYAALYDNWPDTLVQPVRSDSAPAGGPVHVNDVMRLWVPEGAAYWSSSGVPQYSDGLTASGTFSGSQDGFAYYHGNWSGSSADMRPYNDGGPIESRYNRMVEGGRDEMVAGYDEVELPTNTFVLRDAAWGFESSNSLPTSSGVYLNEESGSVSGIYIKGDVEEMELGYGGSQPAGSGTVSYGQNSWVKIELPISGQRRITNNQNYTVVTISESSVTLPAGSVVNGATLSSPVTYSADSSGTATTLMRNPDGSFEYHDSELNGVVYTDGNVQDVWGVNKGRRTLAVSSDEETGTTHDIIIGGKESDASTTSSGSFSISAGEKGIVQYGAVDADGDGILDAPTTADNVLGMIADNVYVSSKLKHNSSWSSSQTQANPLYLYVTVLGGIADSDGTYGVQSYDSGGGGWAYRYGARILNAAGAWGTTSGHGLVNGNTFFDQPASLSPPPYFPSTPTFSIKSYEDIVVTDGETL